MILQGHQFCETVSILSEDTKLFDSVYQEKNIKKDDEKGEKGRQKQPCSSRRNECQSMLSTKVVVQW